MRRGLVGNNLVRRTTFTSNEFTSNVTSNELGRSVIIGIGWKQMFYKLQVKLRLLQVANYKLQRGEVCEDTNAFLSFQVI